MLVGWYVYGGTMFDAVKKGYNLHFWACMRMKKKKYKQIRAKFRNV